MRIGVDKGQQAGKHETKHNWLKDNGHELLECPIPVGDYIEITEKVQSVIDRRGDKLKKMDFMGSVRISVDTKQDLQEVYNNVIGKSHFRFRDECILAQQNSIKLYILVEHGQGIKSLDDVPKWKNPRISKYEREIRRQFNIPKDADVKAEILELRRHGADIKKPPVSSEQLAATMRTFEEKYGVQWIFCRKEETGHRIVELLGGFTDA